MNDVKSLERGSLPFLMVTPRGELTFYTLDFPQKEIKHKFEYVTTDDWAFDGNYMIINETLNDPMAGIRVHYINRKTGLEERVENPDDVIAALEYVHSLRLKKV